MKKQNNIQNMKPINVYINEQCNVRFDFNEIKSKKCVSSQIRRIELYNSKGINCSLSNLLLGVKKSKVEDLMRNFPAVKHKIAELARNGYNGGIDGYQQLTLLVKILVAGCPNFEDMGAKLTIQGVFFNSFSDAVYDEKLKMWKMTNRKGEELCVYVKP